MKTTLELSCRRKKYNLLFLVFFLFIQTAFAANITFSVDVSLLVTQNKFNPAMDQVYIKGSFNSWGTANVLTKGANNVYSTTVSIPNNTYQEFKYYITSTGALNGGWENDFPVNHNKNRHISIGANNLVLATVYYNDADMSQVTSTEHFNFYYHPQDNALIKDFATRAEICHKLISSSLQSAPTEKTSIYLYKNLDQLHLAQGYPENGEYSTGSAYGKNKLVMLSPFKMSLEDALGLLAHEYTHCLEAWKTKVTLPAWLNEGVACYYGRQFSTKDYIKLFTTQNGKPNIDQVFNGTMGYAYSGIVAYYIIKTKGEAAMAKFIENMNYADIGYANLAALQADWWVFLDAYLDYQSTVNVKFQVDMTDITSANLFSLSNDQVFVKGSFNNWTPLPLTRESGSIYTGTFPVNKYSLFEFKFRTNSSTAPNNGLEYNFDETTLGNRLLDVENNNITLPIVKFNYTQPAELDTAVINNKIRVLNLHRKNFTTPTFNISTQSIKLITATQFEAQKPADALPFDVGFIAADGTIQVSPPTTNAQKAVFADINKAAVYYVSQAYMYYYYQTNGLPLLLKVGFGAYEAGINVSDADVKTSINSYGGTLTSFDQLNNRTTFIANNGYAIAHAFGEFINIYKNWGYLHITAVTSNGFDVVPWWGLTNNMQGLLDDFNRYMYARFLQPDENLRVKMVLETENFKFYTRSKDYALNFPYFSDILEPAYKEYCSNFNVKASEKFTYFTLPTCIDLEIEGNSCNGLPPERITAGTAWSSGIHSTCASNISELSFFHHMNRHELAHAIQGIMPQGSVTAWLNEGFPDFCSRGPLTTEKMAEFKSSGIEALNAGTRYFGHRPTYEETKIYPSPDYGYYTLGYFLNDFIYRKGGYAAVKNVQMGDLAGYNKMGYTSCQSFLDDFYFDFDVRVLNRNMVTLTSPKVDSSYSTSTINISWTPLKTDVKLNVEVSTNNGVTWTLLASNTNSTACTWNAGSFNGKFLLKFIAPNNLNIETILGPFAKVDLNKLFLNFPNGNEYLIAGDTTSISWGNTNIPTCKIEFSSDNGTNWTTVSTSTPASNGKLKWLVPNVSATNCKLRISKTSDAGIFDESDLNFTILPPNLVGGPYLMDNNTLALLHFDNDLNNRSYLSGNGNGQIQNLRHDASLSPMMGNNLRTSSQVTIPHHQNLNLTGDWTIEAWVKFTSFGSLNMYIIQKPGDLDTYESNYALEVNPWWGNIFHGFYFPLANSRIGISSFPLRLNEWYHVAFVRNTKNKTVSLIIHDRNRNHVSTTHDPYTATETYLNTKDLIIAGNMDGYVDEVRISNVVRNFITTDIKKESEIFSLILSPNPSNGLVHLEWSKTISGAVNIEIQNMKGQIIEKRICNSNEPPTFDLSSYPKGIYIVKTSNKQGILTKKMVLQ